MEILSYVHLQVRIILTGQWIQAVKPVEQTKSSLNTILCKEIPCYRNRRIIPVSETIHEDQCALFNNTNYFMLKCSVILTRIPSVIRNAFTIE